MPSDCNMKDLQEYLISTFLGVISILNRCFLVVVDEISQLIKLENHEIYQISGVGFFAFDDSPLKKEINSYICNLKKVSFFNC